MRQNSLLHGETLFVVASGDLQDVTLPFVAQIVGLDLSAHTLLVEDAQFVFIDDFEELLSSRCGIGNVQLHTQKKTHN